MNAQSISDAHVTMQLFAGYREPDLAIFEEFINPAAKAEPGFVVDFLGSKIRTSTLWKEARTLDGQRLELPIPGRLSCGGHRMDRASKSGSGRNGEICRHGARRWLRTLERCRGRSS
jgi:hypothetical protein